MRSLSLTKFYRVYKNDTAVTEISVNDFKPHVALSFKRGIPVTAGGYFNYSLLPDESMYYGYPDRAEAMEKAKAGALAYIEVMMKDAQSAINKLVLYRHDHYTDLNVTLLDANIQKLKKQLK